MSRGGDYPGVQHFAQPTGKPCGDCGDRQSEYIVPGVALWVCESCLMKYLPETPERKRIAELSELASVLRIDNALLKEALKPFAIAANVIEGAKELFGRTTVPVPVEHLRSARDVMKLTDEGVRDE